MVLELVYGANFRLHAAPFSEPDPFKGVLGPTLAKNQRKTTNKTKSQLIIYPRGLIATKRKIQLGAFSCNVRLFRVAST
jgi:hypothetical protein